MKDNLIKASSNFMSFAPDVGFRNKGRSNDTKTQGYRDKGNQFGQAGVTVKGDTWKLLKRSNSGGPCSRVLVAIV